MVKRKFMTDSQWNYHQENDRQYEILQNARKNERRALLINALNKNADKQNEESKFSTVKRKVRSFIRKIESGLHD
tara:strand:+ start:859 stop:1083 length:225 start_codon:yes stop_codon:yes gene_type:complete